MALTVYTNKIVIITWLWATTDTHMNFHRFLDWRVSAILNTSLFWYSSFSPIIAFKTNRRHVTMCTWNLNANVTTRVVGQTHVIFTTYHLGNLIFHVSLLHRRTDYILYTSSKTCVLFSSKPDTINYYINGWNLSG